MVRDTLEGYYLSAKEVVSKMGRRFGKVLIG